MIDIKEILKPGVTLDDFKSINYNDPVIAEEFRKSRERQKKILKSKYVDWDKLSRTYMTI